jgi:hypothetical protein
MQQNYRVTPKGKGIFLFEYGAHTNGKYERKSIAQRLSFERGEK